MATHRFLVQATVVGVNDSNVLYPSCLQCYAKMLHNLQTDVWQCLRCNMRCKESELTWRYRLSLYVADTSATCHLSLFGGTLVPHFGCSANAFHQFLHNATTDRHGVDEDLILQALQTALVGQRYIFCLKTNAPPSSNSASTAAPSAPVSTQPVSPRPHRLADLLSVAPESQRSEEKWSDFVAVQMIPVGTITLAVRPSVFNVLKELVCGHSECSSLAERGSGDIGGQQARKERRKSSRKSESRKRPVANISSGKLDEAGRAGYQVSEKRVCMVSDSDGSVKLGESENQGVLSEESSFEAWSQGSDNSQAMLRFSCQSSMDQEFPSSLNCAGTANMLANCSYHKPGPAHTSTNSEEIKYSSYSQSSDLSSDQTALELADADNCDLSSFQDSGSYTKKLLGKEGSTHQNSSVNDSVLVRNPNHCDNMNFPSDDKLNASTVLHKASVINKIRADDETVLDSQATLANPAWYETNMSLERLVYEERDCQPEALHSEEKTASCQDQSASFSSSLNDSSLLLAAVHNNPRVEDMTLPHSPFSSDSMVRQIKEILQLSSFNQSETVTPVKQSETVTPVNQSETVTPVNQSETVTPVNQSETVADCMYTDKDDKGKQFGESSSVPTLPQGFDTVEDMPFSEDLSMFLQVMAEDPVSVAATSPSSAQDKNQNQQHTVVHLDLDTQHKEHCTDKQKQCSSTPQGLISCNKKRYTSALLKQEDSQDQEKLTRSQGKEQDSNRRKRYTRTKHKRRDLTHDRVADAALHEVQNRYCIKLRREEKLNDGLEKHEEGYNMAQQRSCNTAKRRTRKSSKRLREKSILQPKPMDTEYVKIQSSSYNESVCMTQHTSQCPVAQNSLLMDRSSAQKCDDVGQTDHLTSLMGNVNSSPVNDADEICPVSVVGGVNKAAFMKDANSICQPETQTKTKENDSGKGSLMSHMKKLNAQEEYDDNRIIPESPLPERLSISLLSAVKDKETNLCRTVNSAGSSSIFSSQSSFSSNSVTNLPLRETLRKVSYELSPEDLFEDGTLSPSLLEPVEEAVEIVPPRNFSARSLSFEKCEKCQHFYLSDKQTCFCQTDRDLPAEEPKVPSNLYVSPASQKNNLRIDHKKPKIQFRKSSQHQTHFSKTPHNLCKNRQRTSSSKDSKTKSSLEGSDRICSIQTPSRSILLKECDRINSYRDVHKPGSHSTCVQLPRGPAKPKSRQSSQRCRPDEFLLQRGEGSSTSGGEHSVVVMPDSEDLDAFLNNLVCKNIQSAPNDTSAENSDQVHGACQKTPRHRGSSFGAAQTAGISASKKMDFIRKRPSYQKVIRKMSLGKSISSDDALVWSNSQTDTDCLDCSADLFSQDTDDEKDREESTSATDGLERFRSSHSCVLGKVSQPCVSVKHQNDSPRTFEDSASSIGNSGCSVGEKSYCSTPLSGKKNEAQPHKMVSQEQRKVRFSRKRRISSVRDIDIRLERYSSPQQEIHHGKQQQTVHLTPRSSCLKQRRISPSLQCAVPEKNITKSTIKCDLRLPTTETQNIGESSDSHCVHDKDTLNTSASSQIQKEQFDSLEKSCNSGEVVFLPHETSGSQDLFSPYPTQEQGASIQVPPEGRDEGTPLRGIEKRHGGTPALHSDSPTPTGQMSLFDTSDLLFDDSENASEVGLVTECTGSILCSPKQADVGGKENMRTVSLVNRETKSVTNSRKSVRVSLSPAYTMSPDLFSP